MFKSTTATATRFGAKAVNLMHRLFHHFGLKLVLWLPFILTMAYLTTVMIILIIRYDIPPSEIYYVIISVLTYGRLMELSQHIRKKYWGLTKNGRI